MHKKVKNYIAAVVVTVIFGAAAVANMDISYGSMESEKESLNNLKNEKADVEKILAELEAKKGDSEAYLKELDAKVSDIANNIYALNQQIDQKNTEINATQELISKTEVEISEQYEAMKLRIQYMYENGNVSFADSIMTSKNASQLLNRAEYASQIATYDRKMLKEYQATREKINQKEQDLETEHSNLLALQESTEAKQASVKELMSSKQKELTSYNSQIGAAQSSIDQYNADIKAQENQMKAIEEEMKRKEEEARKKAEAQKKTYNVTNLGNISFKWPCPSSGRITSGFGGRKSPTKGASSNHQGIDISASTGASIVAAADGTVVIATYSYSAGNYIMIDHGGGVSTVYMHCSQLLASQGQKVKKGQTIARVGSTGYSTGSHLHFGVRSGGSYVNPSKYVSP